MSIFDVIKNQQTETIYNRMNKEAIDLFDAQKNAIKGIAKSEGYKEIKKFWEREKEASLYRLINGKDDSPKAKAMYTLADSFLKYLEARE